MNKKTVIVLVAIVAVLAVLLLGYFLFVNGNENHDLKVISVVIEVDEKTTYSIKTEGAFAIDALNELKEKERSFTFEYDDGDFGAYITSINGRVADDSKHEYFAFYINGEYASFGISEQTISDKDEIKLVLETW